MATVYLSLGSNLGDRRRLIEEAVRKIEEQIGTVVRQSALYETEPWGFDSPNKFLNAAVCVQTTLCPRCVLERTQQIERQLGRTSKTPHRTAPRTPSDLKADISPNLETVTSGNLENPEYHDRPIDIDILLYDNLRINDHDLQIPHPLMHEREFVMQPLRDILQ